MDTGQVVTGKCYGTAVGVHPRVGDEVCKPPVVEDSIAEFQNVKLLTKTSSRISMVMFLQRFRLNFLLLSTEMTMITRIMLVLILLNISMVVFLKGFK